MDKTTAEAIAAALAPHAEDERVSRLLGYSVGRILLNLANKGKDWQFACRRDELAHVADWLTVACRNDAPWLSNLDGKGRAKKLMKFANIEAVLKEADKAMRIEIQRTGRVELKQGHERLVSELRGGYSLVRMLSPEALDRESSFMQHCIGGGAYDEALTEDDTVFWSLRDRAGKPHVTFEIGIDRGKLSVLQVQGKQNREPDETYMPLVMDIVKEHRLLPGSGFEFDNYAIDEDFGFHRKGALRKELRLLGDLTLRCVETLPVNLFVEGTLTVRDSPGFEALPEGLKVGGLDLRSTGVKYLPDGLSIEGRLSVNDTPLRRLPEGLRVGNGLQLKNTHVSEWPEDIRVGGDICATGTRIVDWSRVSDVGSSFQIGTSDAAVLSDRLTVGGNLAITNSGVSVLPSCLRVGGNLWLGETAVTSVPDGTVVVETLDLSRSEVTRLGENMTIGNLDLARSKVTRLPDTLHVTGDLWLNDAIREIPAGVTVDGDVSIDRAPYSVGTHGTIHVDRRTYSLEDARALLATWSASPRKASR